jgi:hypothetical protein
VHRRLWRSIGTFRLLGAVLAAFHGIIFRIPLTLGSFWADCMYAALAEYEHSIWALTTVPFTREVKQWLGNEWRSSGRVRRQ